MGYFYLVGNGEWQCATQCILDKKQEELFYKLNNNKITQIEDNEFVEFYDKFRLKLKEKYPIFNGIIKTMDENRDIFIGLAKIDKANVSRELLKATQCNAVYPNLKAIKGSDRQGRLTGKSMNIDNTVFVFQSVTGMFEREERY